MNSRFTAVSEHLFRFEDTCNVYVLADGQAGLLIDAGSGAVVDHLNEIGVGQVLQHLRDRPLARRFRFAHSIGREPVDRPRQSGRRFFDDRQRILLAE